MDVQMPVMDGYTATKTLREMGYSNLIICGLSANALTEDLSKAKEVGMNDYADSNPKCITVYAAKAAM